MTSRFIVAAALCVFAGLGLAAWDNHCMITNLSLADEVYAGDKVPAEELDAFLMAVRGMLPAELSAIESEAARSLPHYLKPPAALAFDPASTGQALRNSFVRAIRVNPQMPFSLFVQLAPGQPHSRPPIEDAKANPFWKDTRLPNPPLEALRPGETLPALDVVQTASDEPDFGMDVGLFTDNGTAWGAEYGFGIQPFGNPAISYGSQAPFHMAFPHEDPIIKLAAPFTQESNTAYRVLQYRELARFAFANGHPYWGWRFAGWALHYTQDMAQPYHARVLPGHGTLDMIILNLPSNAGRKAEAVVLLSNRHMVLEDYLYRALAGGNAALTTALRDTGHDASLPGYRALYEYDVIAETARQRGDAIDALVAATFPAKYVSDPSYDYGVRNTGSTRDYDPSTATGKPGDPNAKAFEAQAGTIFRDLGGYSRLLVTAILSPQPIAARNAPFDVRGPAYIVALLISLAVIAFLIRVLVKKLVRGRRKAA